VEQHSSGALIDASYTIVMAYVGGQAPGVLKLFYLLLFIWLLLEGLEHRGSLYYCGRSLGSLLSQESSVEFTSIVLRYCGATHSAKPM
jgi:hypothetical protein